MAIPILTELNQELTRLYIAGSSLAKGDPRITRYIAPLENMGQKAPVFKALATRLTDLTQGDEHASPEKLMEVGMLLNSLMYTQGSTEIAAATEAVNFGDQPLNQSKLSYSRLQPLVDSLQRQTQERLEDLIRIYESGQYRDPRLYQAYCQAVSERKTFVSDYVTETIMPALGTDIAPFIEQVLDLTGDKRDAKLFRALYQIRGKAILELSLKALDGGSVPVMAEALYTLSEDMQYEPTLLGYLSDKKHELRQAAYTALERLGSAQSEALLLDGLLKKKVADICEALTETTNPRLAEAVLETVRQEMNDFAANATKLKQLLEVLAIRSEESGILYIKSLFLDRRNFDSILKPLDLHGLLATLYQQNSSTKTRLVYDIACGNPVFVEYKIFAAKQMVPAAQVYELCYHDCKKHKQMATALQRAYQFNPDLPDSQKDWDRRWVKLFLKPQSIDLAFRCIYDDDSDNWRKLLKVEVKRLRTNKMTSIYSLRYLKKYKELGYPDFDHFYQEFIKLGFKKEVLEERLS